MTPNQHKKPDLRWEPLGESCPATWTPAEEANRLLSAQNRAWIQQLLRCCEEDAEESAQRGLQLLDTLPRHEEQILDLSFLRIQLLSRLGQSLQADAVFFDHIFGMESELLWVYRGRWMLDWLQQHPQHLLRESVLSSLQWLCEQHNWQAPHLIRALVVSQNPDVTSSQIQIRWQTALDPKRWKQHAQQISLWLDPLAHGFLLWMKDEAQTGDRHQVRHIGQIMMQIPWIKHQTFTPQIFDRLCQAWQQAEMLLELKKFCESVSRQYKTWVEPHVWLGRIFLDLGKEKKGIFHIQQAQQMGGLLQSHKIVMIQSLLQHRKIEEVRSLLSSIDQSDDIEFLQLRVQVYLYEERLEEALTLCERILSIEPSDRLSRLHSAAILEALGQWEKAEAMLRPWVKDPDLSLQTLAHFLLARMLVRTDRWTETDVLFQFLLTEPHTYDRMLHRPWQQQFLEAYGICLERHQRYIQAISSYRKAWSLKPSWILSLRILWLLIETEQWDEAQTVVKQWDVSYPLSPWFVYARIQVEFRNKRGAECLADLEHLGLSWLEQQDLLVQGLSIWAECLWASRSPWEAFVFCETWLDQFVSEPSLRELRQHIFRAVEEQFTNLTSQLDTQDRQIQELQLAHQRLDTQQQKLQLREKVWQGMLQQQQESRDVSQVWDVLAWDKSGSFHLPTAQQEGNRPHTATPPNLAHPVPHAASPTDQTSTAQTWPISLSMVERLPVPLQTVLQSAAFLWGQLQKHPQHDHSPIVMQLARVVEGEVNRLLIDPLVKFALQQGWSLADFPTISAGNLLHEHNRVSLGDAAMLLYHQIEQTEADGSITILRNPRSHGVFRNILEPFWQQFFAPETTTDLRRYIQHELPVALQELSRWRNQASHAGAAQDDIVPFRRTDMFPVVEKVLGSTQMVGILPRLLQLHPAPLDFHPS